STTEGGSRPGSSGNGGGSSSSSSVGALTSLPGEARIGGHITLRTRERACEVPTVSIRLAAVQPRSHFAADEAENLDDALRWLDRAHAHGADLVLFPEGYPGPTNPANDYDALTPLSHKARSLGLHVVAGGL